MYEVVLSLKEKTVYIVVTKEKALKHALDNFDFVIYKKD